MECYTDSTERVIHSIMSQTAVSPPTASAPPARPLGEILQEVVKTEAFRLGMVVFVAVIVSFWALIVALPHLWLSEDGYYSHGFLVPFIAGYIVYRRWPKLSTIPVKPGWFALVLLVPVLYLNHTASVTDIQAVLAVNLVLVLLLGTWFIAGWQWMWALFMPIMYLLFCMPIWVSIIEIYTNPLQQVSTKVAFQLLILFGFQPLQVDSTSILVNTFMLDVGVPCSGLKLLLALSAFSVFFVLIANLKWWGNALMLLFVLPLALFINGLRIALIGVVGDTMGSAAGHQFHDYSGYITLLLCFVIVFKTARILGWKD
jgi:exosortase